MTDYEVWMEIAIHAEESGVLPTAGKEQINGLCNVLLHAVLAEIIPHEQQQRLVDQLYKRFNRPTLDGYFWPVEAIQRRIDACKYLAQQCLERDGR